MSTLTHQLIQKGHLRTDIIIDAFAAVPRAEFMTRRFRSAADVNIPVATGFGLMMPAPSVIAEIFEHLDFSPGQSVMLAGTGTGWVVALLNHIVGTEGHVTSYDMNGKLQEEALKNIAKLSFIDDEKMLDMHVIASCDEIVQRTFDRVVIFSQQFNCCDLTKFLADGGKMIAPDAHNALALTKKRQ